jgi:pimeloyl-ACP methyl ester carboxylesterase
MQIVVDGLLTHVEMQGKGKLVLVLHGWGDNLQGLAALQAELAKDYKVLALDLPGFGVSQAPKDVWNLDNYSRFIESLLKKMELSQPYAVIGHSNGGALAIKAVSTGKLQPEKLVLLAASGVRNSQKVKRFVLKVIAKLGNAATIWMPERYRRGLRKSLYGVAGSDMLVEPQLEETFKKTVRQDVQKDAAKIDVPTLLVYGENDRAVPIEDARTYNRLIKNSRLEVVPDAEHFVHLDKPARVTTLIKEFLK